MQARVVLRQEFSPARRARDGTLSTRHKHASDCRRALTFVKASTTARRPNRMSLRVFLMFQISHDFHTLCLYVAHPSRI